VVWHLAPDVASFGGFRGPVTGLSKSDLEKELGMLSDIDFYVRSLCAYRHHPHQDLFALTVSAQPEPRIAQGIAHYDDLPTYQQARGEFSLFGIRPALLVPLPRGRRVVGWRDESFGSQSTKVGLDLHSLEFWQNAERRGKPSRWIYALGATSETVVKKPAQPGREPGLSEHRVDTFDVSFVEVPRVEPVARHWRDPHRSPNPEAFAEIDDYMHTMMTHYGVRHAQIAISYWGALKYAATYNHLEPGRAEVTNDNRFRLGSCAKSIAAVALMSLWQDDPSLLGRKVIDLLGPDAPIPLVNFFNEAPTASQFQDLTVDDCVLHLTGFAKDAGTDDLAILARIKKLRQELGHVADSFPLLSEHMPIDTARMVAHIGDLNNDAFQRSPGKKYRYDNTGFFLLGRVVHAVAFAKDSGLRTYRDVIANRIYDPLGVNPDRVHLTRDFVDEHEPVYHPNSPRLRPNVDVNLKAGEARPLRYKPYTGNAVNSDAAGGFALRAVDHVRLLAGFDIRHPAKPNGAPVNHPFLSQGAINKMFEVVPTPSTYAHGKSYPTSQRRGWVARNIAHPGATPPFDQYTAYYHAGGSPGTTAYALRTTAGVSLVVAYATDLSKGPDPITGKLNPGKWSPRLSEIMRRLARIPSWPDGDHFHHFGIPDWAGK
jgi:CubicO group peptidase (beta-lactamase class C family)